MITLKIDPQSDLTVPWPRRETEIVALAEIYVQQERSLPEGERLPLPSLADIEQLLAETKQHIAAADAAEANRADAAQTFNETLSEIKGQLQAATLKLKAKHLHHLAGLEAWGLDTVSGPRGIQVRSPRKREQIIACLNKYIAKEQLLPETERITAPDLAEMESLAQTLNQSREAREVGRREREMGVEKRRAAAQALLILLQVGAANLVIAKYGGRITEDLQQWGYAVITRTRPRAMPAPTEPEKIVNS